MNPDDPHSGHDHARPRSKPQSLGAVAFRATVHCLSGCAVGEVLGMVIGTAMGLSNAATIALAVALSFLFGYAFTIVPLLRTGMPLRNAARLAFGADTISITIMEVVDNGVMFVWPGAMEADLGHATFWIALAASLVIAGVVAYPANRWLISRGRGHALAHGHHAH
ncbi:DUF4396 domain-containing protein [Ramlibacter sp. PS3R-8]|uniref:DUF4396 domain-containing protein n=1 Tax=Ramlibacter sp. PS3R-8 TaxID=3133437 RepID=UPI0030A94910